MPEAPRILATSEIHRVGSTQPGRWFPDDGDEHLHLHPRISNPATNSRHELRPHASPRRIAAELMVFLLLDICFSSCSTIHGGVNSLHPEIRGMVVRIADDQSFLLEASESSIMDNTG